MGMEFDSKHNFTPSTFAGDLGSVPGEGKGYPLQYSGLENPMGCIVHGVAKSWTRPSDFHFHLCLWFHYFIFHFHLFFMCFLFPLYFCIIFSQFGIFYLEMNVMK